MSSFPAQQRRGRPEAVGTPRRPRGDSTFEARQWVQDDWGLKGWKRWLGPLLVAGVALVFELIHQTILYLPNPPAVLLLVVAFSAFTGGMRPGLASAGLAWLYIAYFFSIPGQPFQFTDENLRRVGLWVVTTPAMALMIGFLRGRLDEARRAEQAWTRAALQETRLRLDTVVSSAPVILFAYDRDGRVTLSEGKGLQALGLKPGEMVGRYVGDAYPQLPQIKENFRRALAGETFTARMEVDGLTFETRYSPLTDALGGVTGVIGVATDITERVLAEREREQVNAALERRVQERTRDLEAFTYSVSHDLRAPLRTIAGFSTSLTEDYSGRLDADGRHLLDRIQAAALHMGALIDALLSLARIQRKDLERHRVDLTQLVRSILDELQAGEPGRKVEASIQPGLDEEADPALCRVLLENLLRNAWKFTGPRPLARIEFGRSGPEGSRAFFVRDNGVGFRMEDAGSLFQPFARLHAPSRFPGTGMGLAIVQRIVDRHGGTVWAEAQPDGGATFTFSLGPPLALVGTSVVRVGRQQAA